MTKNNGFKVAALAASIALAMGATSAMAADPAANALPGQGKVTAGTATGAITGTTTPTLTITTTSANAVINWGQGTTATDINNTGTAGFNIGKDATVDFVGATGGVLNIDSTGNASQIFGHLNSDKNVYVANANGIIVGKGAAISSTGGDVGLIANTRGTTTFDGTVAATSVEFQGTGGDVTVAKGATIDGANVLVSGGGTVNVDLSALTSGNATVQAGVKNSTSSLVTNNTSATLTTSGDTGGATLTSFASAGDASVNGTTLALGGNAAVAGTLTNTGTLTLAAGFNPAGGLVNNKTVTQTANASMGSLVNNGAYTGGGFTLTTTKGGITNSGSMTGLGDVSLTKGDLVNNGTFDAGANGVNTYGVGNVTNNGNFTADYVEINEGGNFTNAGTMTLTDGVYVQNGSITNNGKLTANVLRTWSDTTTGAGFTAGGQYYVNNTGTVTSVTGNLRLSANADFWGDYDSASTNDSTGSVTNTGTLQVGTGGTLDAWAHNGVNLAGTVQAKSGTSYKALSATNALGGLTVYAGGWNGTALNSEGAATIATDLVSSAGANIIANQVKLMSNLSSVDAGGDPTGTIAVSAGARSSSDYAVRVAGGKTVTAKTITVNSAEAGDESNVILQGTLAAQDIAFGATNAVSDVYTGPTGSLSLSKVSANPTLTFNFTGAVKTVPYNNTASNFRYNGLNVMTDGNPLALTLNPTSYTTNGTTGGTSATRSGVNILVNGDVNLSSTSLPAAPVGANGTAVTGVTNTPNTHLVLQSSGNIDVGAGGDFYWPGYVYLGNVLADSDGNAQPGTAGLGTIKTDGNFNNVLPGDVAGASGIHFITQFPLTLGGDVVTNANAWVNFGTDLLTTKYAGEQNATTGPFFGGTQGSGSVINYGVLDAGSFHTHAPDASK